MTTATRQAERYAGDVDVILAAIKNPAGGTGRV